DVGARSAAARARRGGGARSRRRRAARRARQRRAHCARGSGGGEREVRHPAHPCGQPLREDGARQVTGGLQPASPLSFGSMGQLTLSLLAIVALILVLGWVLRRLKFATPRAAADMRIIDEIALGPRERIALVRVGDAQVLVGIGTGGIVPLTPLD